MMALERVRVADHLRRAAGWFSGWALQRRGRAVLFPKAGYTDKASLKKRLFSRRLNKMEGGNAATIGKYDAEHGRGHT